MRPPAHGALPDVSDRPVFDPKQWDGLLLTYSGIKVPDWSFEKPVTRKKESKMKIIRVGVDLAKSVFQVHGVDRDEKSVWRRKLGRNNWLEILLENRVQHLKWMSQ